MSGPIAVVIPARWQSSRFPGKVLTPIGGRPMLQRVVEQCRKARLVREIYVATDDSRVFDAACSFGVRPLMTRKDHLSGTDRVAEAAKNIPANIIVNVQGDEPLISPKAIDELIRALLRDRQAKMATLAHRFHSVAERKNPNVVKVVVNRFGQALYFSRNMIPYVREKTLIPRTKFLRHFGVYAYRRNFLLQWGHFRPSPLERAERLEQLRALENGVIIRVIETRWCSVGVDVAGDVARVEALLKVRR